MGPFWLRRVKENKRDKQSLNTTLKKDSTSQLNGNETLQAA